MEAVREMFPEHVISLRGELPWPARSPDLSACDYSLWRCLKAKVYTTRPRTIDDLKVVIPKQIETIPGNMATEHWETCKQGCKSVYTMMGNILVMCCSKRNKQRSNEMYVE
jgi:hypothetical protein